MLTGVSRRLPVEVISLVFDWVDLAQLLLVSCVCARWRAVARSHPLFWRKIRLRAISAPALDLFEARLEQTTENTIEIIIQLMDVPLCGPILSVVLPAIARNLRRVRHIGLFLHCEVAPDLFRVLSNPAPRLEHLGLLFYHLPEGRSSVVLQPDLFACASPKLNYAALTSIDFPQQPVRAFQQVQQLLFDFSPSSLFDFGLFTHFPALTSLTVFGDSCMGTGGDPAPENTARASKLTVLEVNITSCDYDSIFLSIPNLAQIPVVKCRRPQTQLTRLFATHLDGEIEMSFLCTRHGLVHIALFAPFCGRWRTLIEVAPRVLEDWPREVLFEQEFTKRVTILRVYAQLAYLAPHFGELSACHTLEIVVDHTEFPPLLSTTPPALRLPALKTVVVMLSGPPSTPPRTVTASALRAFLVLLVGETEKRPVLELEGISVSGDSETLKSAFELK